MANRSYIYSLSNRPKSYRDRPETISGLSEWPYDIPFLYRLLMSGDPQLCASLISDGFEDDEPENKTNLYAISSRFDLGFERVKRFNDVVRLLAVQIPLSELQSDLKEPPISLFVLLKRLIFPQVVPAADTPAVHSAPTNLPVWLDEMTAFLEDHRNDYLLLETIELNSMSQNEEAALRVCVEREITSCLHVGAAIDALSIDLEEAGRQLKKAITQKCEAPLDAFFGLRLDDECDSTRSGATEYPLGVQWFDELYFGLLNKADFEARDI